MIYEYGTPYSVYPITNNVSTYIFFIETIHIQAKLYGLEYTLPSDYFTLPYSVYPITYNVNMYIQIKSTLLIF